MSEETPTIFSRFRHGFRGFKQGYNANGWFSPGEPVGPTAPDAERVTEYPVSVNTTIGQQIDWFKFLREFSDQVELVRLAIETRKDQISRMRWEIIPKGNVRGKKTSIKKLMDFFEYPDREHSWSTWIRVLIEDVLTIDAPTLLIGREKGEIKKLDYVDGTTIQRLIDYRGRTPKPPTAAYQQVLYGSPAVLLTTDDMIYMPRNVRSHKIYGFSPTEQVFNTGGIFVLRQLWQKRFYTDGTTPDMVITASEGSSADQMKQFERKLVTYLSGNLAGRRQGLVMPPGYKLEQTKPIEDKTDYDEWLARIVCFAFKLPATPFVRTYNRSTAESAQETAQLEGLYPLKQWVKELIDYILHRYFLEEDLEFVWVAEQEEADPLTKMQTAVLGVNSKIWSVPYAQKEIYNMPPEYITPTEELESQNQDKTDSQEENGNIKV